MKIECSTLNVWLLWKSRVRWLKMTMDNRNYGWHCIVNSIDNTSQHSFCLARWLYLNGTDAIRLCPVHTYIVHVVHGCDSYYEFYSNRITMKKEKYVKEAFYYWRESWTALHQNTHIQTGGCTRWKFLCHALYAGSHCAHAHGYKWFWFRPNQFFCLAKMLVLFIHVYSV